MDLGYPFEESSLVFKNPPLIVCKFLLLTGEATVLNLLF